VNGRNNGSWWGWLLAAFVLLAVFGDRDIPVLPLIIGFFILANVFGRRRPVARGRRDRGADGHGGPHVLGSRADALGGGAAQESPGVGLGGPRDTPMPTIDVPHYPGEAAPPTQPYRYGTGATPPPPAHAPQVPPFPPPMPPPAPQASPLSPQVPPPASTPLPAVPLPPGHAGGSGAQGSAAGTPHTSTDPVVSLGQLHLARCGRDLQSAVQHGTAADVARVLEEIRDLSRRMQDMLDAAEGTPGAGRREFRAGLRAIDRLVEDAREEQPPGARLTRVTQACLRMGQTGRHE
jgi:hypothetical protein